MKTLVQLTTTEQMDHHNNAKAIRGTHPSSDEYNPGVPNLNKLLLISALLN